MVVTDKIETLIGTALERELLAERDQLCAENQQLIDAAESDREIMNGQSAELEHLRAEIEKMRLQP